MRGHFKNIQDSLPRTIRALTRGHAIQNFVPGFNLYLEMIKGPGRIKQCADNTQRSA